MDPNVTRATATVAIHLHGLLNWSFEFHEQSPRLGTVRPDRRIITLNRVYAASAPMSDLVELLSALARRASEDYDGAEAEWPKGEYEAICPSCRKSYFLRNEPNAGSRYMCLSCEQELRYE